MTRFVQAADRHQVALLPDCLDDYVTQDNPTRVVDAFVDELDLAALGFAGVTPAATGRPGYHPATLLKLYLGGERTQTLRLEAAVPPPDPTQPLDALLALSQSGRSSTVLQPRL